MGIQVGDNFDHKSKKPLDARTSYTTLAAMKAVADANIYEGCEAYCAETDKYYKFKSTNEVDENTGKWRERESGGSGASSLSDLTDTNISSASDGQLLGYDNETSKWKNVNPPSTSDCYKTDDTAETTFADNDYVPFYDTSANGKRKSLWSNIKTVLKTYFDTLYNAKLTAGTNISISGNTISAGVPAMGVINKSDLYDTSEHVVGKWVDGRPLYQKSYTGRLSTSALETFIDSSFSYNLIEANGVIYNGTDHLPVNFGADSSTYSLMFRYEGTTKICIGVGANYKGYYYRVTARYTKDSDAANSYNYSSENDYSTNEHIIGTWEDGSTLYQRTYTGTTSSNNDTTNIVNMSYHIKEIKGMVSFSGESVENGNLVTVNYYGGENDNVLCFVENDTLKLYSPSSDFRGRGYAITIKYTK